MVVFFVFAIFFLGLVIVCPRSRLLLLILSFYGACVLGFNYDNHDYENYVNRFKWATYPNTDDLLTILDFGSNFFYAFVKDIGVMDYERFLILQAFLIFAFVGVFAYKKCLYPNLYIYIYIVCFLIIDTIQIRNFVAFLILLPFIPYLGHCDKKSLFMYLFGLFLSTSYHFSMISFSIFTLLFVKSRIRKVIFVTFILLLLIAFSSIFSQMPAFERVDGYTRSSLWGAIFMSSHCLISTFFIVKVFYPSSAQNSELKKMSISPDLIKRMNIVFLLILPIFLINASISRMFRFVAMINILFMLNVIYYSIGKKRQMLSFVLFVYIFYFGCYYIYSRPEVYKTVLIYNHFLSWFA